MNRANPKFPTGAVVGGVIVLAVLAIANVAAHFVGLLGPASPVRSEVPLAFIGYESSPAAMVELTDGQREIIASTAAGSFKSRIIAGKGEFRFLDKDNRDLTYDAPWVQTVAKRSQERGKFPYLFATHKGRFYEGDVPQTAAQAHAILDSLGVPK